MTNIEIPLTVNKDHPMYRRGYADAIKNAPPRFDPVTGLPYCGCGGKASRRKSDYDGYGRPWYFVECTKCRICTMKGVDTQEEADEIWYHAMGYGGE